MIAGRKLCIALAAAAVCSPNAAWAQGQPLWWGELDPATGVAVIDPNGVDSPYSPASIGQAKWMASRALDTLDEVLPQVAFYIRASFVGEKTIEETLEIPPGADAAWFESQKAPLLIGQLKALATPFYDELNWEAPLWLDNDDPGYPGQLQQNQTKQPGSYLPWGPGAGAENNHAIANIGQLKAVFSLRFRQDADLDSLPDLWEGAFYSDITLFSGEDDFDDDGLSNFEEFDHGTDPVNPDTDDDGVSDGDEIDLGGDPNTFDGWDGDPRFADNPQTPSPGVIIVDITGNDEQDVPTTLEATRELPAGPHDYLAIVMVESDEFPVYTGDQSQWNDEYEVTVEANSMQIINTSGTVNPLHGTWIQAFANGEQFFGYRPPAYVEAAIIETSTTAPTAVDISISITNIEDAAFPTTVVVALIPLELIIHINTDNDDDYIAVSSATDPDLATEIELTLADLEGWKVNLSLTGDGAATYEKPQLTLDASGSDETRVWGTAHSSAKDSSNIKLEIMSSGDQEITEYEDDVTVFEGVEIEFSGKFIANVNAIPEGWRPHPVTDAPAWAQDVDEWVGFLQFQPGDQTGKKRPWAPSPDVEITGVATLQPPIVLGAAAEPLVGAKMSALSGFFEPGAVDPRLGNEDIEEFEVELRKPGEVYLSAEIAIGDETAHEVHPGGDLPALGGWDTEANIKANVAGTGGAGADIKSYYEAHWLDIRNILTARQQWTNDKLVGGKGGALSKSIVAKGLLGKQELAAGNKVNIRTDLQRYNIWYLQGEVANGKISNDPLPLTATP